MLVDLANTINAKMASLITAAGYSNLVPTFSFGPTDSMERNEPPRLSWKTFGRERFTVNRMKAADFPRSIKTRVVSVNLELWAPCLQVSPMTAIGSTLGDCIVSGKPVDATRVSATNPTGARTLGVYIQIVSGGALGTATYLYSLDSGNTWTTVPDATGAAVALGSSGLIAAFSGGPFQVGDLFTCVANDFPVSDFATAEWLLGAFINAVHQVAYGAFEILDGEWGNQDSSDTVQEGKLYKCVLDIETPVREMFAPGIAKALVTSIQQTDIIGSTVTQP